MKYLNLNLKNNIRNTRDSIFQKKLNAIANVDYKLTLLDRYLQFNNIYNLPISFTARLQSKYVK